MLLVSGQPDLPKNSRQAPSLLKCSLPAVIRNFAVILLAVRDAMPAVKLASPTTGLALLDAG